MTDFETAFESMLSTEIYFTVMLFSALVLVFFAPYPTSAGENKIEIHPLVVQEQSFDEWINQDFRPPDPLTVYSSKEKNQHGPAGIGFGSGRL